MADIFVHIFGESLRKLMKSKHRIIAGEKDQLQYLYNNVYHLSNFLQQIEHETRSVHVDDEKVNCLVTEIRKVVREAEIIVDTFIADAIGGSVSSLPSLSISLKKLQKQFDAVKIGVDDQMSANLAKKIEKMTTTTDSSGVSDDGGGEKIRRTSEDDLESAVAVGIDETIDKILVGLIDAEQSVQVISVVGLPGIGKTTLAHKVFDHTCTRTSFQIRAWVTVSQTYSIRRLLIDILHSSSLFEDDDKDSAADKLGEDLLKRLKGKKYLIVLDDIWSAEAWYGIQRSFPDQHNGSRVLFTSRSIAVGKHLSRGDINNHNVGGLSEEHSWNLLKNKVFGDQRRCPSDLEKLGMEIARKCDGLPLAIVVIGGLLAKKDKTPRVWKQVATSIRPALATHREAYMDTLALSYQDLPLHLKACFLYLGAFPEGYEIPVRSLIWLLAAEGLVIQDQSGGVEGNSSAEVIVEGYLNELVERSLVIVARKRSCGAAKTFRVHDLLRDLCIVRGKQENFIAQLTSRDIKSPSFDTIRTGHRCLFVDDSALYLLRGRRRTPNLRSLVHIPEYGCRGYTSNFYADRFRLLKVLEILKYSVNNVNGIENLVHLKYLAVSFTYEVKVLPSSITKLLNLETLFLHTRTRVFNVPDDIWYMSKLRHLFKKGGVFHFEVDPSIEARRCYMKGPKRNPILGNLQTLHPLCACKSCLKLLVRTPNIRKLGISENQISSSSTIPNIRFLKQLESLKVKKLWYPQPWSLKLPAFLRKLTLEKTYLKWGEISVLAELENLEVLKLLENACVKSDANSVWDTSELDFPKLKYLKMERLDIVKWEAFNLHIESLEVLVLEGCYRLETIPFELAQSSLLRTIEVTRCNISVERYAKEIEEEHEKLCGDRNLRVFIIS